MLKAGADSLDQARIKKKAAEGMTAVEISQALQIELKCVESFMPGKKKSRAKK